MNYSRIVSDGAARDEALKRRDGSMREVLGIGPKPDPDTKQPAVQEADEKPSE